VRQDHGQARFRVLHVGIVGASDVPGAGLEHFAGGIR
jgi:hypothetical protein